MSTLAIDTIQGATTATSVDMSGVTGLQMPAGHVIQVAKSTGAIYGQTTSTSFGILYAAACPAGHSVNHLLLDKKDISTSSILSKITESI